MKSVNPYLIFDGNTEEAFNFYKAVFGGEFAGVVRFKDMKEMDGMGQLSEEELNKIANIALPLGKETLLMGNDAVGQPLKTGNNVQINLELESAAETERIYKALSEGGEITMPLQKTEWAEKFGGCTDKFGIIWTLNYTGNVQFGGQADY